ncbi:CoA-dependent acyltransferase [Lizonia empirigonia]|nr:CoA-dependent acyltransferase [Lizonia empirigonia]
MSRAGGKSTHTKNTVGHSRSNELASSIRTESHSGVSNYWGDNNSVTATAPQSEEGKKERLLRWSAHTSSLRASRPRQVRRLSSRSNVPRTIGEDSAPTKRKSLLGTASLDNVISKVQVFKGGISDILPVTDFQALAMTGSLLESKWMLNYFYLEANGQRYQNVHHGFVEETVSTVLALYDDVCIGKILDAFQAAYNGKPIPSAPKFGNFVRASARTIAGAHNHWRQVLSDSTMTQVVDRFGPNYQRSAGHTITLERNLIRNIRGVNITTASVVKAAWAYTLARTACKSDIVFGHVISGRNSDVGFANVVGPCLNTVLVRVVYRLDWSVLDLLSYIQEQQIANMPYESLGFREITRHCTDWPAWTTFSSVLQHDQNLQPDNATLQLGDTHFKLGAAGTQQGFADFSINSTSNGVDKVGISLTYVPNSTITIDYAQRVFEMFCASIVAFSENPHEILQAPSELSSARSPAIDSKHIHKKDMQKTAATLPTDTGLPVSELRSVVAVLRSAWQQILHDGHGTSPSIGVASDFFRLGGDVMGLAQVVAILSERGFVIKVEDMLDNSNFVDQIGLLVVERKKQLEAETQNGKGPWGNKGKKKKVETGEQEKKRSTVRALVRKVKARVRRG